MVRGFRVRGFRAWWVLVMVLVVAAVGCRGEDGGVGAAKTDEAGPVVAAEGAGAEEEGPPTPQALSPVMRAMGPQGVVPQVLGVEFFAPVAPDAPTVATEKTELRISPVVEGELSYTTPTSLRFVPEGGFRPGTSYEVTLGAVETPRGVVRPAKPWTYRFTTPAFGFVRLGYGHWDEKSGEATVDVVFSAPVRAGDLGRFARWEFEGREIRDAVYHAGAEPNEVRVVLSGAALTSEGQVKLALRRGMPYSAGTAGGDDGQVVAEAAEGFVELRRGPAVEIISARLEESPAGYYVDVVCNDRAVARRSRYYWDERTERSYNLSARCELEAEEAKRRVRFNPPVDFDIASAGYGFRLFGDFGRGEYTMRIEAGARSVDGGMVEKAFEQGFTVGARSPALGFVTRGRYLPRDAWSNLAVRHLNVDAVALTLRHVPAQNLVFWLGGTSETVDARTSNVVLDERVALRGGVPDVTSTSFVNLATMFPEPKTGLYEVAIRHPDREDVKDVQRLLLTDINLVAKQHAPRPGEAWSEAIEVWALHMRTTEPMVGVRVDLVRPSGQTMASCTTGGDGGCRLDVPGKSVDPTAPIALVATKGDDMTYLKYRDLQINTDGERVQGEPYLSTTPYRAVVYSDRGVYRPGETAHFVAMVRDADNRAPSVAGGGGGLPVELRVVEPRGQEVRRVVATTNAAGLVSLDLPFGDYATTGAYTLQVLVATKPVTTYRFSVEEFVPERMRVSARTSREAYRAGDEVLVAVEAEYLFGGSAEGSAVELTCRLQPARFTPKQNGQFHYGQWRDRQERVTAIDLGTVHGEVDGEGRAQLRCPQPGQGRALQVPGEYVIVAAVHEGGSGRTTQAEVRVPYHPERYHIGLASDVQLGRVGQSLMIDGRVVDWSGAPVDDVSQVTLEMFTSNWNYSWYRDVYTGEESYGRYRELTGQGTLEVPVKGGRFSVEWTPREYASGLLVVAKAGNTRSELYVNTSYDEDFDDEWVPYNERASRTPRPLRPTGLTIEGPDEIEVGKPVEITFTSPYKGRALLTVETNEVVRAEWRPVVAGVNTWTFTLERFVPNVYVSAFVVKDPHLESKESFVPDRAFGVRSVRVRPQGYLREVRLAAPAEVRSNSKFTVDLEVGALDEPTYATIAVVDEGVLSLTGFASPDLARGLFTQRGLGVTTYETVGWALQMQAAGTTSSTGGGDFEPGPSRAMPVRPVAMWSGLVEVAPDGKLSVDFDVGQYRGALRVMAVVAGATKMGAADTQITVRDPLTLQTTLPRFLTAGDEAQIPVFVTNLTDGPREIEVVLEAGEAPGAAIRAAELDGEVVRVSGGNLRRVRLLPGQSMPVVFGVRALREAGVANFRVRATSGELTTYDEAVVPLVPAGPSERVRKRLELTAGVTDLGPHLRGWVPTSERTTIWVSAVPHGEEFGHLPYLLRYPYGCLEQTTSATRPLLFASSVVGLVDPAILSERGRIEEMMSAGIERILSMKLPDGGFSYWQSQYTADPWSTTYAVHLLLDARELGYPVPDGHLEDALRYIERELNNDASSIRAHAEAYAHYVLARAERGRKARILQLVKNLPNEPDGEQAEQAYLLKAALYLSGDRSYEADLRRLDASPLTGARRTGWSFYSDLRRRAFALSIFLELFGDDTEAREMARPVVDLVSAELRKKRSNLYTTQELAWSMTALGRWTRAQSAPGVVATLRTRGRALEPQSAPKDRVDRSWFVARASEYDDLELHVESAGAGAGGAPLYAYLVSEGVRAGERAKKGGEGMRITREYLDAEGTVMTGNTIELGSPVYTRIRLTNTGREPIYNVALVERFPAGWEIENPRLGRGMLPEWVEPWRLWSAQHMNVRDDRLEVFGRLERNQTVEIVYTLRAVTAGRFTVPPVEADAMYDPRIWARETGDVVEVEGPWAKYVD